MDGQLVPDGLLSTSPLVLNLFENVITVQFTHRVLAIVTLVAVTFLWLRTRPIPLPPRTRGVAHLLVVTAFAQVALGILTLLLVVPVALAAAHQAGALALFTLALWLLHELRPEASPLPYGVRGPIQA